MKHPDDPSENQELNIEIPRRGEYQAIIDRHSYYHETVTRYPLRGIIRADEQPFDIPLFPQRRNRMQVSANRGSVVTTITDEEVSLESRKESCVNSCLCLTLSIIGILLFIAIKDPELSMLQVLKFFPLSWAVGCMILAVGILTLKRLLHSSRLKRSQQRVPTMNLPTSWPCLLPGNHQDHGCQQANEDVSEAYPPELPTYARSLSCPLAILEIPFVPSPPPKYRTSAPVPTSPLVRGNTPPPPYVELEEETLAAQDRIMEEQRQELEAEYRRRLEDDDPQTFTRYTVHVRSPIIYHDDEIDELEDEAGDHIEPPRYE